MVGQGRRQVGSTIKPFLYALAMESGYSPYDLAPNVEVTYQVGDQEWTPRNASSKRIGEMVTLKWGLAHSRNNYSAWIMKQAKQPGAVADFIHNMGIHSFIDPVYALCLGTFESNVFEMVSAYSTFANEGVYVSPLFVTHIEDRQGNLISSFIPQSQDAVNKHTAYTMLTMLQRVISAGTGGRMTWQFGFDNMDIGGKTGTSNENRDAWFMCVTPTLVAGSWVGGEDQSVHFKAQGEGSVMALPIVGEFLKKSYADPRLGLSRNAKFSRPEGWVSYDCPKEMAPTEEMHQSTEPDEFFGL
jgi:penicillin-binding protein 1A